MRYDNFISLYSFHHDCHGELMGIVWNESQQRQEVWPVSELESSGLLDSEFLDIVLESFQE